MHEVRRPTWEEHTRADEPIQLDDPIEMYQVVVRAREAGMEERPQCRQGEEGEEEIRLKAANPRFAGHGGIIA
jgi:hypothetical protein